MRKIRRLALIFTALLPGFLKRPILRHIFGYRIGRNVRIGMALLDCRSLSIGDNTRIGGGVVFIGCGDVSIGANVNLGFLNVFRGANITLGDYCTILRLNLFNAIAPLDPNEKRNSVLEVGFGTIITAEHRIDCTDLVRIGKNSILGGRNSSIWTHLRHSGLPVTVGDFCYIGSEVRLTPGCTIPSCSVLGIGSVVTKPLTEEFCLYAGAPAHRIRPLGPEDYDLIFLKTRPDLPDQQLPEVPVAEAQSAKGVKP